MFTSVNLEALSTSLSLTFQDFISEIYFGQIDHKFKTLRDLLKNLRLINLERVE